MVIFSIFDQFQSSVFFIVPMIFLCLSLNVVWSFFLVSESWSKSRFFVFWSGFVGLALKLIFQTTSVKTGPWASVLFTVFVFILSINVMGLFPYLFTSTSHVSITFSIGFPLWLGVNVLGFYFSFGSRLSHLVPQGTPIILIPLMVWIETLSLFAQPLALGLRLAANLTAGHLLIFLLVSTVWAFVDVFCVFVPLVGLFFLLLILEIAVACIQAYVFTALVHFYLQENF
uniref:ATP synthase subunit a n=1 Tax=Neogymnocrinus richeri TaxID=710152 RepID=Q2QJF1_9ECHI|nr:ATP synthase F0 subunit 6 [Neogymnocrinus richeri]AAY51815.1 ATPase subunit 6 [Neogymnocrinus richeri]